MIVGTFFGIVLLWDGNENGPFPLLSPLLSFPNLLTYWVQHLTAPSFRSLNSSAGILPPPLALFIVMLPKAHLTSHSRMSNSRWVTAPLWLSGPLRLVLYSSSVYSCHLFLISAASITSLPFLSFIMLIFVYNVPLVFPNFLNRSTVFPILLFSSICLHCSFKKVFLALLTVLWNSAFSWVYLSFSPLPFASLLSSIICEVSADNHFATFLHFFFFGMVLISGGGLPFSPLKVWIWSLKCMCVCMHVCICTFHSPGLPEHMHANSFLSCVYRMTGNSLIKIFCHQNRKNRWIWRPIGPLWEEWKANYIT